MKFPLLAAIAASLALTGAARAQDTAPPSAPEPAPTPAPKAPSLPDTPTPFPVLQTVRGVTLTFKAADFQEQSQLNEPRLRLTYSLQSDEPDAQPPRGDTILAATPSSITSRMRPDSTLRTPRMKAGQATR